VLAAAGHIVHGADVVDYGWRPGWIMIRDYLEEPVFMGKYRYRHQSTFSIGRSFHPQSDLGWLSFSRLALAHELSGIRRPVSVMAGISAKPDLGFKSPVADDAPDWLGRPKGFVKRLIYVGRL